jgi:hypothetical protein
MTTYRGHESEAPSIEWSALRSGGKSNLQETDLEMVTEKKNITVLFGNRTPAGKAVVTLLSHSISSLKMSWLLPRSGLHRYFLFEFEDFISGC